MRLFGSEFDKIVTLSPRTIVNPFRYRASPAALTPVESERAQYDAHTYIKIKMKSRPKSAGPTRYGAERQPGPHGGDGEGQQYYAKPSTRTLTHSDRRRYRSSREQQIIETYSTAGRKRPQSAPLSKPFLEMGANEQGGMTWSGSKKSSRSRRGNRRDRPKHGGAYGGGAELPRLNESSGSTHHNYNNQQQLWWSRRQYKPTMKSRGAAASST